MKRPVRSPSPQGRGAYGDSFSSVSGAGRLSISDILVAPKASTAVYTLVKLYFYLGWSVLVGFLISRFWAPRKINKTLASGMIPIVIC
jgi:hypothetical protein